MDMRHNVYEYIRINVKQVYEYIRKKKYSTNAPDAQKCDGHKPKRIKNVVINWIVISTNYNGKRCYCHKIYEYHRGRRTIPQDQLKLPTLLTLG